jgi:hypothetical protein
MDVADIAEHVIGGCDGTGTGGSGAPKRQNRAAPPRELRIGGKITPPFGLDRAGVGRDAVPVDDDAACAHASR